MIRRLLCLALCLWTVALAADTSEIPVAYHGRIRPLEAASRLWLYDLYHAQTIRSQNLSAFHLDDSSAEAFQWSLNLQGHTPWDKAPLFWVQNIGTKELLGLSSGDNRFSYTQLREALIDNSNTNLSVAKKLTAYAFNEAYHNPGNRSGAIRLELSSLAPGLWAALRGDTIVLVQAPAGPLWQRLTPGTELGRLSTAQHTPDKAVLDELTALWNHLNAFDQLYTMGKIASNDLLSTTVSALQKRGATSDTIAQLLQMQQPLRQRLLEAGADLRMLPGRLSDGEWYSIRAVDVKVYDAASGQIVPVSNFTVYSDALFERIRSHYHAQDLTALADDLAEGYRLLAGTPYREAAGKSLYYPTVTQLKAEAVYYRLPMTTVTLIVYAVAAIILTLALSLHSSRLGAAGLAVMAAAWLAHTAIIALRCYILARPPVANMFETLVYVPWVAVALSLLLYYTSRSLIIPLAASVLAVALLTLLQVTHINSGMETLQPVLDSQYWLIIHVLLVVASYGVFLLSGILGHLYLGNLAWNHQKLPAVAKAILHTMYLGTAMLIAGTILGGVWAAESWGRFWDWDPKESWAFISACLYLVCIHAYTFSYIKDTGLAVGSIVGLWAITFTWYGVNYILGTGLHSYGFGNGGEGYYYAFLAIEVAFVAGCLGKEVRRQKAA